MNIIINKTHVAQNAGGGVAAGGGGQWRRSVVVYTMCVGKNRFKIVLENRLTFKVNFRRGQIILKFKE